MKTLSFISALFFSVIAYGQETQPEFDTHKWEAPYLLPIPKNWTIERFLLPPSFAPGIKYKGMEDIRFTPGWGKTQNEEYWTYAFLWFIDDLPMVNKDSIKNHLEAYYTGLIKINSDSTKQHHEKPLPVTAKLIPATGAHGDLAYFTGTIHMLDFLSRQPITLHCKIHVKRCQETKKTILFFELSPQVFENDVWKSLDQLWLDFKCQKD